MGIAVETNLISRLIFPCAYDGSIFVETKARDKSEKRSSLIFWKEAASSMGIM